MDWLERVKEEHQELIIKHNKLLDFINSEEFNSLPLEEMQLLMAQNGIMQSYIYILDARITIAEKK